MRRAILLLIFLVLLGSASFLVADRWLSSPDPVRSAETPEPGMPGPKPDRRSVDLEARGSSEGRPEMEGVRAFGPELGDPDIATRPSARTVVAKTADEWIEEANAALRRGDASAEALQLSRALEAQLQGNGAALFDAAVPILERLRAVNERVWFDRSSTHRSRLVDPAPLARVARVLAQQSPPIQTGIGLLARMNRLANPDVVPGDRKHRVPTDSILITVRRSSFSISVKLGDYVLDAFRAGIGRSETPTPTGVFTIVEVQHLDRFQRDATRWVRPEDGAVFFYGDPEYPFGKRFLRFAEPWGSFGIHGTDSEQAIGAAISHGCVRMRNVDVETLASWIDPGARCAVSVRID